MSSIARNNVDILSRMGYKVTIHELEGRVDIGLRLRSNANFMVSVSYYDLQCDEMVVEIVASINRMIMGRLVLDNG